MDKAYQTELLEDSTCIKRSHRINEGEVALFIRACSNGELLTFKQVETEERESEGDNRGQEREGDQDTQADGSGTQDHPAGKRRAKTFEIAWSDKALDHLRTDKSLKVTFAYNLDFLPNRNSRAYSTMKAANIETASQRINDDPFEEHSFVNDPDVNQALRRNLAHILSVCSIPVISEDDESKEPAFALTCGDVDGHRVATAASFYCFEFLLLALDYFKSIPRPSKSVYIYWMTERILKTCNGHLKWLFGKEYRNLPENPSAPHCWVNGKVIDGWDKNPYLPSKPLVEVPFQIIKAGDFYGRHKEWEVPKETGTVVEAWIKELDERNKLGCYAFPRDSNQPTHHFYFTDHVFIWRAIKSVESLGFKSKLSISIPTDGDEGDARPAKKSTKSRNYYSIQVQNQILKRFTTENPISKKQMIAVSRSPAHNRFLLRTKDAGLFHAMDLGFFDKPGAEKGHDVWQNKVDTWRNLVDCQVHHDDNDDTTWDEPLRFALSFIMAQAGKCMNLRSVDEMRSHAISVLLQSAWPNGLLAGRFDANKEPILYDAAITRDKYWASSFEMPYILWKYSRPPLADDGDLKTQIKDSSTVTELKSASSSDAELLTSLKMLLVGQMGTNPSPYQTAQVMKRTFTVNNVVDQKNIVELSDEWLYKEPDFFAHVSKSNDEPVSVRDYDETFPGSRQTTAPTEIAVVDVPRTKDTKKNSLGLDDLMKTFSPGDFKTFMQKKRSQSKAKKRFCALFGTNPPASAGYHQTPSELPAMMDFSERHGSYDKFFSEVTAAELNTWTTELHLSFYAIGSGRSGPSSTTAVRDHEDGSAERLVRIAMSLRFNGDFFDRYWTCHFLESNPIMRTNLDAKDEVKALLLPNDTEGTDQRKAPWRQRRVLELLLFNRIIGRMQECTTDIFEEARHHALNEPATSNSEARVADATESSSSNSSDVDYEAFRTTSNRYRESQQLLQTVEQDLQENLAQIEQWMNREKERETERPRWTFNDESRYRSAISKHLVSNQRGIQALKRTHAKISNLNDSLSKKLEIIRSDLDQRRADDIERFTYVTVFFCLWVSPRDFLV
ncbi:hypothetical protein NW754_002545 [Fusarium falciforme]|nr:hypothetical protein NW754_002545 [Fusarium falciforme]